MSPFVIRCLANDYTTSDSDTIINIQDRKKNLRIVKMYAIDINL